MVYFAVARNKLVTNSALTSLNSNIKPALAKHPTAMLGSDFEQVARMARGEDGSN